MPLYDRPEVVADLQDYMISTIGVFTEVPLSIVM